MFLLFTLLLNLISIVLTQVQIHAEVGNYRNINMKTCGLTANDDNSIKPLIANGDEAKEGEFPWMAHLIIATTTNQVMYCGGAIINGFWILTTNHCVKNQTADKIEVRVGSIDKKSGLKFNLKEIYGSEDGDIALLELSSEIKPVKNTSYYKINGVCLPKEGIINKKCEEALFSGFGNTNSKGDNETDFLRKANYKIQSNKVCGNPYRICVQTSKHMACFGDSGSALIQYVGNRAVIIGLEYYIQWKNDDLKCGSGIIHFVRISHYIDWIQSIIAPKIPSTPITTFQSLNISITDSFSVSTSDPKKSTNSTSKSTISTVLVMVLVFISLTQMNY